MIGGASPAVGKTELACRLIRCFSREHEIVAAKVTTLTDRADGVSASHGLAWPGGEALVAPRACVARGARLAAVRDDAFPGLSPAGVGRPPLRQEVALGLTDEQ